MTMVLSALAVIFIQTEASQSAGAAEMASYTVFKIDDSDGSSNAIENFEQSFLNALVIVCVIACMTFGIVLVYKFRCMMFLIGYMILSSCTLLGLLGGTMAYVAVEKFRIPIDWFSFVFLLANFAIVGATAIFFGKGIPMYIIQAYLVATSIILAWQLSHFDPWTAWIFLRLSESGFDPIYFVYGRDGKLRRVLILDPQGRVFQESDESSSSSTNSTGSAEDGPASIRLCLGDFIYCSVLVAQAAAYGFTTFVSCTLVILAGLGGTLVLLSVYHKALPALPISIFLGVATYLLTRAVVQPWIFDLLTKPYYV